MRQGEGGAPDRAALREATLAGVRWTAIARVVAEVTGLASAVVLAHLVPPAEFGRAAIALIVHAIAIGVAGAGFATPLVQRKDIDRNHLQGALLLSLLFGVGLMATTIVLAPVLVAPALGERTALLVQIASPFFLFGAIGAVPQALLQRRLDFKRINTIGIISVVAGAATSVGLGVAGYDAEAVVLGVVVAGAVNDLGSLACARIPWPHWRWREMREIGAFGLPTALSSLTRSGFRNVDYAILAAVLGPAQVGFYWRAFQLGVEYQRKISGIMMRVALPVYSRAATPDDMKELRMRIVRTHAVVIIPLLAFFAVTAPITVPWLFGAAWEPAVLPSQILAGAGMLAAVMTGMGPLLLAVGRPRALLAWDAASLVVYAAAILVAGPYGLTAACCAVVGVYLAQFLAAHYFLLDRLVGIPMRSVVTDVAPAALSSAALAAVALPIANVLERVGAFAPLAVVVAGVPAGAAYLLTLRWFAPAAWSDLMLLVRRVAPGRRRSQARPEGRPSPVTG